METRNFKYISSCVFSRDYPGLARRANVYIRAHCIPMMRCCVNKYKVREFEEQMEVGFRDEWKAIPHYLPFDKDDVIVSVCHNCMNIIAETHPGVKILSIYELILMDDQFQYPDYHGVEMTIQDCWRAADHTEEKKAVRLLMEKMNIRVREIEKPEDFCGISLYRPQPPRNPKIAPIHYGPENTVGKFGNYSHEEQVAFMKKHAERIPTDHVTSYCHYCQKGLELSGKKAHHMVELLFPE